ncbi:hypothetical protein, conserved [Eimeria tenella]|uniref:Uncharacterized protein n=1 Tax=Eimeria tenella TaxID=5802 RepID=U6KUF7_EIMTE|nr:hypothetical protein, conserved [Eimeria tenella]CDJ40548.1 hypothetical protein, conserved [Eimeria tenella]|eukprot:XP_013231298.1 hypothetical protein, conserved [Eimeria tenella]
MEEKTSGTPAAAMLATASATGGAEGSAATVRFCVTWGLMCSCCSPQSCKSLTAAATTAVGAVPGISAAEAGATAAPKGCTRVSLRICSRWSPSWREQHQPSAAFDNSSDCIASVCEGAREAEASLSVSELANAAAATLLQSGDDPEDLLPLNNDSYSRGNVESHFVCRFLLSLPPNSFYKGSLRTSDIHRPLRSSTAAALSLATALGGSCSSACDSTTSNVCLVLHRAAPHTATTSHSLDPAQAMTAVAPGSGEGSADLLLSMVLYGSSLMHVPLCRPLELREVPAAVASRSFFAAALAQQKMHELLFQQLRAASTEALQQLQQTMRSMEAAANAAQNQRELLLLSCCRLLNEKKQRCKELQQELLLQQTQPQDTEMQCERQGQQQQHTRVQNPQRSIPAKRKGKQKTIMLAAGSPLAVEALSGEGTNHATNRSQIAQSKYHGGSSASARAASFPATEAQHVKGTATAPVAVHPAATTAVGDVPITAAAAPAGMVTDASLHTHVVFRAPELVPLALEQIQVKEEQTTEPAKCAQQQQKEQQHHLQQHQVQHHEQHAEQKEHQKAPEGKQSDSLHQLLLQLLSHQPDEGHQRQLQQEIDKQEEPSLHCQPTNSPTQLQEQQHSQLHWEKREQQGQQGVLPQMQQHQHEYVRFQDVGETLASTQKLHDSNAEENEDKALIYGTASSAVPVSTRSHVLHVSSAQTNADEIKASVAEADTAATE